jgi:hypothetical protein
MKKTLLILIIFSVLRDPASAQSLTEKFAFNLEKTDALDYFGYDVNLSADGSTAIVGAYMAYDDKIAESGKAIILVKAGNIWAQQATLRPNDPVIKGNFGYSVGISADGNTAVVGAAYAKNDTIENAGKIYIFHRNGDSWTQAASFISGEATQTSVFGWDVAISADGKTVITAAKGLNRSRGKAYVYTRNGNTWSKQADIVPNDPADGDSFGTALSLSGDGNLALISSYYKTVSTVGRAGKVYVFKRTGSTWSQVAGITAADKADYDNFGTYAEISEDGKTAIIASANKKVDLVDGRGKVYIYSSVGDTWTEQAVITDSEGQKSDYFGRGVLSADGNLALIGVPEADMGGTNRGKVYVYQRTGSVWSKIDEVTSSEPGDYDFFGRALDISADGKVSLVSSFYKFIQSTSARGKVYFFDNNIVTGAGEIYENSFSVYPNPTTGKIYFPQTAGLNGGLMEIISPEGVSSGKIVITGEVSNGVNINGPAGLYLIRITEQTGKQTILKIMKD